MREDNDPGTTISLERHILDTWLAGIDIGGTKSTVCIGDAEGKVISRSEIETAPSSTPWQTTLKHLCDNLQALIVKQKLNVANCMGIGTVCGSPLNTATGEIVSPPNLPGWQEVPILSELEAKFKCPVYLENDANASALAEKVFGSAKSVDNFIYLTWGTGVGAGIVVNGSLVRGASGQAGEAGHQTILPGGPQCLCGKKGCLEAIVSGPAIANLARERGAYGRQKRLITLAGGKADLITAKHVVLAAQEGDPFSIGVLEEAGTYMGIGIANLIQILNPEMVFLGTLAISARELLMDPIQKAIDSHAWKLSREACKVVPSSLGELVQDLSPFAVVLDRVGR